MWAWKRRASSSALLGRWLGGKGDLALEVEVDAAAGTNAAAKTELARFDAARVTVEAEVVAIVFALGW